MKIPKSPPKFGELFEQIGIKRWNELFLKFMSNPPIPEDYLHWDDLNHREAPADLTHQEWWILIKQFQRNQSHAIPLLDKLGQPFSFNQPDPIPEMLHLLSAGSAGSIEISEHVTNTETRDRYYVSSLIEEAITSSQLEGATTTRQVAKEMLRTGRTPRDKHERMIYNNFLTMQKISQIKKQPLTKQLIFEIHRCVTENTLEDPTSAGRFRLPNEDIVVADNDDQILHHPPHAKELDERMQKMCDFANSKNNKPFIHPALRAILLHFWLAYDHPFVDGNGRTARAIFYWSMLNDNFWLFEFISISRIILKGPSRYGKAFLHTETDGNDLTYFILYHLDIIKQAMDELHKYLERKSKELRAVDGLLVQDDGLNPRQRALLAHALRHPSYQYTVDSHKMSHQSAYETARSDLYKLVSAGFLKMQKIGKTLYFSPVRDLKKLLEGKK